ncbi:hypothetical protein Tco_0415707 [Tanacetum coccineum]
MIRRFTSDFNARKRKIAHPLSIPRVEEPSSSGNMIRRFTVGVNNRSLRSKSSCAQGDASSYIDLGNCDQVFHHRGCLFWYNERLKGTHYAKQAEYHLCCGGGQIYMPLMHNPPTFIQQLLTNSHFIEHIRAYNQMFVMMSFGANIDDSVNKGRGPEKKVITHAFCNYTYTIHTLRTARVRDTAGEIPGFKIRLYNMGGVRGYELPTSNSLEEIVFESV